jgi:hypothetical protein
MAGDVKRRLSLNTNRATPRGGEMRTCGPRAGKGFIAYRAIPPDGAESETLSDPWPALGLYFSDPYSC